MINSNTNSTQIKLPSGVDENGTRFFYDITTKNLSFLQTATDLKKLGIKNNMFFLKLYDRNLVGVDPFSPSLSNDQISRIILECTINPYYFIREVVRIPIQGGATGPGAGSRFILHRGNLAALYCFENCIDFFLVISRQCFKTWSLLVFILWAYLFGTTNSTFNFSNKDQPASDDNLAKLKALKEALPIWMQQRYRLVTDERTEEIKIEKGIDNIRRIKNPITHNQIDTKPSANTLAKAETIGRGNSAPIQYYDEVEFTLFIGVILKASGPAYSRAAENCEKTGAIHCRMLSSTPKHLLGDYIVICNAKLH